jgi:hypothetical protein
MREDGRDGRTDGHDEAKTRFSLFSERAYKLFQVLYCDSCFCCMWNTCWNIADFAKQCIYVGRMKLAINTDYFAIQP